MSAGDSIMNRAGADEVEYIIQKLMPDKLEVKNAGSGEAIVVFNAMILLSDSWWAAE